MPHPACSIPPMMFITSSSFTPDVLPLAPAMLADKYHLPVAPSQFMYIWNLKLEEGFGTNFFRIQPPRGMILKRVQF